MASMEPLLTCLVLGVLATCTGVTHWKLKNGVITAVNSGDTVFTAAAPTDSSSPRGSCGEDKGVIHDRILAVLRQRSTYNGVRNIQPQSTPVVSQECPLVSASQPDSADSNGLSPINQHKLLPQEQCVNVLRDADGVGFIATVPVQQRSQPQLLTCGEPPEFTSYDFLPGIAQRHSHPPYPEPEVAMIFRTSDSDTAVNLFEVEMRLRVALEEAALAMKTSDQLVELYNRIGNYWRIKGNTLLAVDCFRQALAHAPTNPDVLLNLARVLYNLNYIQDSIFLAKQSLEEKAKQPPENNNAWLQYFTLGEAYKAQEDYDEAAVYFQKTLQLNPSLHIAEVHLREIGRFGDHFTNGYTVVIIVSLIGVVMVMVCWLLCEGGGGGGAEGRVGGGGDDQLGRKKKG